MNKLSFFSILVFSFSILSCGGHDHDHDHELITTVELTLTSGSSTVQLVSKDLDGDGPNAPIVSVTGSFQKNLIYEGTIRFLNELKQPIENVTEEIEEKDLEHQVFYMVSNNLGSFQYTDFDSNSKPLGLSTLYTSENIGSGNLRVVLRHMPNKNASGVVEGNIANAGGETDIEVNFDIVVVD
jgi:hypothetical protein